MVRLSDLMGGKGKPEEKKPEAQAPAAKTLPKPAATAPPAPPIRPPSSAASAARPAVSDPNRLEAYYAKLIICVKELFVQARDKQPLQLAEASILTQQLPKLTQGQYDEVLMLDDHWPHEHYLISHSVHVSFLTYRLAQALGYTAATSHQLVLAGLLIDIGMAGEIEKMVEEPKKLSKEEQRLMSQHPINAIGLLQKSEELSKEAIGAIAAHHQRPDGSGYPKEAPSTTAGEYAKILAVADVYDALTHARSWRRALNPAQAIKMLIEGVGDQFDRKIIKVLVDELSLYPRGSMVKLNTNEVGVVHKVNPTSSLRPIIMIHRDSDHNPVVPPRMLNLLDHPLVYIKDIVVVDES